MFDFYYPMGHGGFHLNNWSYFLTPGGILMGLFFIVLVGLLIYFAVTRGKNRDSYQNFMPGSGNYRENPIDTAKMRFAKGEISKEELEEILKTLK